MTPPDPKPTMTAEDWEQARRLEASGVLDDWNDEEDVYEQQHPLYRYLPWRASPRTSASCVKRKPDVS